MDYSLLDRPEVTDNVFHPRGDYLGGRQGRGRAISIPVGDDAVLDARFHANGQSHPNLLFFHGNGEIVSDYDDFGPLYNDRDINFMVVDYRGYGRSTGSPTVSHMMSDCHAVLDYFSAWLEKEGFSGPLLVMGRSLGSASAIELAVNGRVKPAGLIVESGFAFTVPLLRLVGVPVARLGLAEEKGVGNLDKMKQYHGPLLIIHAEFDHIIPFGDALALYEAAPSRDKTLLKIPRADHNNIFHYGLADYMAAVSEFLKKLG